jgi:two-component system, LuxR family, response regulator FixJ
MEISRYISLIGKQSDDTTALAAMLRGQRFLIAEYETSEEFLLRLDRAAGGCVVIKAGRSDVGLELQKRIRDEAIELPIVILCENNDVRTAVEAMKNGAFSVVELSSPVRKLLDVLVESLRQESALRSSREHRTESLRRLQAFNEKERRVAELLLAGASNKVIANRLEMALRTVEFYRSTILKKMGVRTIAEFVQIVMLAKDKKPVEGGNSFPKMLHNFDHLLVSGPSQRS